MDINYSAFAIGLGLSVMWMLGPDPSALIGLGMVALGLIVIYLRVDRRDGAENDRSPSITIELNPSASSGEMILPMILGNIMGWGYMIARTYNVPFYAYFAIIALLFVAIDSLLAVISGRFQDKFKAMYADSPKQDECTSTTSTS